MSQSSTSSEEAYAALFLPDGSLISDAVVITEGKRYDCDNGNSAEVSLNDTSVLQAGEDVYRAVCLTKQSRIEYHQLQPEQEETVITEACKTTNDVKVSFTRWTNMVRKQRYPEDATDAERRLFQKCLLSTTLVKAKLDAKRARDAASRRKRMNGSNSEQPEKVMRREAEIEINARGPGNQVIELLRGLVNGNNVGRS